MRRAAGEPGIYCWGTTGEHIFRALTPSDEVLVCTAGTGRFTHYGRVIGKERVPDLGAALWSFVGEQPWDRVYFLGNLTKVDYSKRQLLSVDLGYKPNDELYSNRRVPDNRRDKLIKKYGSVAAMLGLSMQRQTDPADALHTAAHDTEPPDDFDASDEEDTRKKVMRDIAARRGQSAFRNKLMLAYGGKCAITRCDAEPALEAAHIKPYRGDHLHHTQNGLLLRADIHTLFDAHLIAIDPIDLKVIVAKELVGTVYKALADEPLMLPRKMVDYPNRVALAWHKQKAGL